MSYSSESVVTTTKAITHVYVSFEEVQLRCFATEIQRGRGGGRSAKSYIVAYRLVGLYQLVLQGIMAAVCNEYE